MNHFQGFIIQARAVGDPRPVGTFQGNLLEDQTYMWCSGGEPQVSRVINIYFFFSSFLSPFPLFPLYSQFKHISFVNRTLLLITVQASQMYRYVIR